MAKVTDAQLTAQAEEIRNETDAGGNTRERVADALQNLIDSKPSNVDLRPWIMLDAVDISDNLFPTIGGTGDFGAVQSGNVFPVAIGGELDGEGIPVKSLLVALADAPGQDVTKWRII